MTEARMFTLNAVKEYWKAYDAPPPRKWIMERTGLSRGVVTAAIRFLDAEGKVYAPKHETYIGLPNNATGKDLNPWD